MAKQQDKKAEEQSAAARAGETARKGGKAAVSLIGWLIPLAALVIAGFFVFRPSDPMAERADTPDGVFEGYAAFVRPYVPPSALTPAQNTVEDWLDFFDEDSGDWFEANFEKVSYVAYANDRQTWNTMTKGQKRMAAMQYLLTRGPLQGGAVRRVEIEQRDDLELATLDVSLAGAPFTVPMVREGETWVFREMMGQRSRLDSMLAQQRFPGGGGAEGD